jgi:hypothetical protein
MNSSKLPSTPGFLRLALLVLVGAVAFSNSPPPAAAQSRCWTTVGSAGTVDEADTGIVSLALNNVTIKPTLSNATLNVRYNIVATDGLFGGDAIGMGVRYGDNGPNAHVAVRLREVNFQTGVTASRMLFDSNAFPQATGAQTQFVNTACFSGSFFDFSANVYYLDAELSKTGVGGTPVLGAISICHTFC